VAINLNAYKLVNSFRLLKHDPLIYSPGEFHVGLSRLITSSSLSGDDTTQLSVHLCEQLLEMHRIGICHGDIRINNVFYDGSNGKYVLAGFQFYAAETTTITT
jgi:serine/threonine protein kinase